MYFIYTTTTLLVFLNSLRGYGNTFTMVQPLGPVLCEHLGRVSGSNASTFDPQALACTVTGTYTERNRRRQSTGTYTERNRRRQSAKQTQHNNKNTCIESTQNRDLQMRCVMCTDIPKPMTRKLCHDVDGYIICSFINKYRACVFTSKISDNGKDKRKTEHQVGVQYCLRCSRKSSFTRKQRQWMCTMLSRLQSVTSKRQTTAGDVIWVERGIICKRTISGSRKCDRSISSHILKKEVSTLQQRIMTTPEMVNCRGLRKEVPIMMATRNESVEMVDLLLGLGADLSAVDSSGDSIIHKACECGSMVVLKRLVELGLDLEKPGNWKKTPLLVAAGKGKIEIIDYLLSLGCNFEAKTSDRATFLHEAYDGGNSVVQHILEKNISGLDIEMKDRAGNTLLLTATTKGNVYLVEYLQKFGYNMSAVDKSGNTIVHKAVYSRKGEMMKYLVSQKTFKLDCANIFGLTPLEIAIRYGFNEMVSYLKK